MTIKTATKWRVRFTGKPLIKADTVEGYLAVNGEIMNYSKMEALKKAGFHGEIEAVQVPYIPIDDTIKIGNVYFNDVAHETVKWLHDNFTDYRDQVSKEDLINICSAFDIIDDKNQDHPAEIIKEEVKLLHASAVKKDCAYIRFIV